MADSKATALTADTSLEAGDIFYVVIDTGGTPASRKVEARRTKPRVTTAQRTGLGSPQAGDEVFDTDLDEPCVYTSADGWVSAFDGLPV